MAARGRICRDGLRSDGVVGWIIMSQSRSVVIPHLTKSFKYVARVIHNNS